MLLFVYGTLRRGADNHAQLGGSRMLGRASTAAAYELVDMGGYPALLEAGRVSVVGELYEVGSTLGRQLDAFEEVPSLYVRKAVALDLASRRLCRARGFPFAEAYVMARTLASQAPRIRSGDWLARGNLAAADVPVESLRTP